MDFLRALQLRCEALIAAGRQVILVGDLNVCHREIDHCDPGRSVSERGIDSFQDSGERKWLARLLVNSKEVEKIKTSCGYRGDTSNCTDSEKEEAGGGDGDGFGGGGDEMGQGHFVDSFRFCHPTLKSAFSCWNTLTDARAGNYGTRIDYILVTRGLVSLVQDCFIASQVTGSDHAPVVCTLSGTLSSSSTDTNTTPDICSSNWPEVKGGKQAKINAFFGRKQRNDLTHTITTNNNHNNPTISSSSSKASSSSIASGNIGGGPKSKKKQQQQQQSSIYRFITSTRPSTSSKPTPESSSSVLAAYSPFSSSQEDVGGGGGGASSSTSVLISENELAALMAIPDIDQPPTPKKRENTNNDNGEEYINDISSSQDQLPSTTTKRAKLAWDRFLRAPDPPKCHHNESCKSFNVNKPGVNQGRKFWLCSRPVGEGYMDNKKIKGGGSGGESQGNCVNEFRCNFFMWHSVWVSKQPKRE